MHLKLLLSLLVLLTGPGVSADEITINISDSQEVPARVFPADGDYLILALPSEHGFQAGHESLSQSLAKSGAEVWQVDFYAAYFLPVSPSSLDKFAAKDIAQLIKAVMQRTTKSVYLMSHDSGVVPMLEGLRNWQQQSPGDKRVKGVLMISPNLFQGTPAAGQEIEYRTIARQTNFNMYVIQPSLSPKNWQLQSTIDALTQGGSDVYVQRLRGVRDRYFFRPDATTEEDQAAARLADRIINAMTLTAFFHRQRSAAASRAQEPQKTAKSAQKGFRPYAGNLTATDFSLQKLGGGKHKLSGYRGQVVLLNFWASWCPPCIHEMPSMQALKDRFQDKPFEIVAVNMAEDPQTITDFLAQMDVDFEILMDSDGQVLRQWKVFAYPTSYVLDDQGRIRYAGFGAIDWAEDQVIRAVEALLEE